MRDGCQTMRLKTGIAFQAVTDNTPAVSAIVDTLGWAYVVADITTGAIADTDATFTLLIEDGNDSGLSDNAAVADQYLVSQTDGIAPEVAASFQFDSDNQVRKIEVLSPKRYLRATITPANNTGSALLGLVWRLGAPHHATVTQPAS